MSRSNNGEKPRSMNVLEGQLQAGRQAHTGRQPGKFLLHRTLYFAYGVVARRSNQVLEHLLVIV